MSDDENAHGAGGAGGAADGAPANAKPGKSTRPAKPAKSKPAAKGKKGGKTEHRKPVGKKARAAQAQDGALEPSVARHPRAGAFVRRAKGWGGLAGFLVAAYLSMQAGVPTEEIGIRALAAGVAGYLLAWACSVTVWRHLVVAELRVVAERRQADRARGVEAGAAGRRDSA